MKPLFALSLGLLLLSNCTVWNRVKSNQLVTKATLTAGDFYRTVDYELVAGIPIFTVRIAGKDYRFMFDTGGYTVFSEAMIAELGGLRPASYIDVQDGNSQTARIYTYLVDELQIGAISFTEVGMAKIGFTESEWFGCLGIDGTIGPNIMKECLWLFDSDAEQIILTDRKDRLTILTEGQRVPIQTNNIDKPIITYTLGGYSGELTFDTGHSGLLNFRGRSDSAAFAERPFIDKIGQRNNAGNSILVQDIQLVRLDSINISGLVLRDVVAEVKPASSSNILGIEILETHRVLFNLGEDEVYFQLRAASPLPKPLDSFGLGYDFREGKVRVGYVYRPSAASELGLVPGEEILRINGQALDFRDFCDFADRFDIEAGEEITLEVIRDGRPTTVTLQKVRLL